MAVRTWRLASVAHPVRSFSTSSSSKNADYLQDTVVPMHHFQRSLPRLPIPKLEASCSRYLDAQRPLLDGENFSQHEKMLKEFEQGVGAELHKELVAQDKQNKHTSYITDYWFDMYLRDRSPLPLNYNPFIAFTDDTNPGGSDQVTRAATLVSSAVRFMRTYRDGKLQPELYHMNPKQTDNDRIKKRLSYLPEVVSWYGAYLHKIFPLDMSQYTRLFNTTRVPCKHKDELATYAGRRHVAVLSGGNFFTFDVLKEDGSAIPVECIYSCLRQIKEQSNEQNKESIACLTSDDRNQWAAARLKLVEDPQNAKNLELIDSAVFMLVLEDAEPDSVVSLSNTFLFGEAHNRWFDKSLQLIVCKGGRAAVNFEHAWGDGVAVLRFLNEVYADVKKHPFEMPLTMDKVSFQSLPFNLNDSLKSHIAAATRRFDDHTQKLRMATIQYPGMNKKFLKDKKLSGDAILQFSLQLAFYRQHGYTPATYESCSTAAFKHGRTETVRPATVETVAGVAGFENKTSPLSKEELRALIDKASEKHSTLIKQAATGNGFDRHLFALKKIAEASGKSVDLFSSHGYKDLNHIVLSTSTLSSPAVMLGGFAPVVNDGLGVGYRVDDNCIASQVTAYHGYRDPDGFVAALESSLRDIQQVFDE